MKYGSLLFWLDAIEEHDIEAKEQQDNGGGGH
jgi:hypothetical protein